MKVSECYIWSTSVLYFFMRRALRKVILNAIGSGGTASLAPIFLFFRELNLKFVIYDVV